MAFNSHMLARTPSEEANWQANAEAAQALGSESGGVAGHMAAQQQLTSPWKGGWVEWQRQLRKQLQSQPQQPQTPLPWTATDGSERPLPSGSTGSHWIDRWRDMITSIQNQASTAVENSQLPPAFKQWYSNFRNRRRRGMQENWPSMPTPTESPMVEVPAEQTPQLQQLPPTIQQPPPIRSAMYGRSMLQGAQGADQWSRYVAPEQVEGTPTFQEINPVFEEPIQYSPMLPQPGPTKYIYQPAPTAAAPAKKKRYTGAIYGSFSGGGKIGGMDDWLTKWKQW